MKKVIYPISANCYKKFALPGDDNNDECKFFLNQTRKFFEFGTYVVRYYCYEKKKGSYDLH